MGRDFGSSGFEDHRGASTLPWGGCRVNRFALPRAFPRGGAFSSVDVHAASRLLDSACPGGARPRPAFDSVDQIQAQVGPLDNLTLADATADDVRASDITAAAAHPAPGSRHRGAATAGAG